MARVKLMSAMAYDLDTFEREGITDPALAVHGELPAPARPFGLNRVYKGPQGVYEETALLLDPDGLVIWEKSPAYIELRGEMFEDLFRDRLRADITIAAHEEHQMVFLVNGREAGRIPVFVDAPESLLAAGVVGDAIESALKKGSILWVDIPQPDGRTLQRPAWYVQQGRSVYVLKGGSEQELPMLEHNDVVDVIVKSKDVKAAIAEVRADVRVIDNASDDFERIATQAMGVRLNLPDGEGALERWKRECIMVELALRA